VEKPEPSEAEDGTKIIGTISHIDDTIISRGTPCKERVQLFP
jgi:hypothetical protein